MNTSELKAQYLHAKFMYNIAGKCISTQSAYEAAKTCVIIFCEDKIHEIETEKIGVYCSHETWNNKGVFWKSVKAAAEKMINL